MMVSVTGHTLLVTSQYDVILTFANHRLGLVWRSLLTQRAYYSTRTLLVIVQCVTVMHIN